jgi:hypothetical protein
MVGASLFAIASPTVAHAGCPTGVAYAKSGKAVPVWIGTNVYSGLVTGKGSISQIESRTLTATATASASFSVSAGVLVSAKAEVGISLAASIAHTRTWALTLEVPAGTTARAHFFKRGYKIPTKKYVEKANCTTATTTGYTYAPVASNSLANYCLARDAGAITKVIDSATCRPT